MRTKDDWKYREQIGANISEIQDSMERGETLKSIHNRLFSDLCSYATAARYIKRRLVGAKSLNSSNQAKIQTKATENKVKTVKVSTAPGSGDHRAGPPSSEDKSKLLGFPTKKGDKQ